MAFNILSKLASVPVKEIAAQTGKAIGSVMDRFGFTEKLSEEKRIDKYVKVFKISEDSTESAREMFMTEMRTQKQPWMIRLLNGFIRPYGGVMALSIEFYAMLGSNLGKWFEFEYVPVVISVEQHLVLGAIIAFFFGSRLSENSKGVSSRR